MDEHEQEMVDLLVELARAESPTPDPAAQADSQTILREAFAKAGYEARLLGGGAGGLDGGRLLVRPPRDRRANAYQMMVGHSDTVWDTGTLDTMPLEIREGRLHGPGTFDMKAGLVQMIFAVRALDDLGLTPAVTPVAWITTDEEIGSPYSERQTELLARRADRALILEPSKGPTGLIKTGRKGNGSYKVTVRGKAAHAGLDPESGASAILAAAGLIRRLYELNDLERGTTVSVGLIEGGTRPNVVAAECRFTIDFRATTFADIEAVTSAIEAMTPDIPGTTVEFEGGAERGPVERTPRNQALWHATRDAGAALGLDLDEVFVGGGSDGNITSAFTPTIDGLGPVGDGAHARHEHVVVASLPERSGLLAMILLEPPLANGAS